MRKTFLSLFPGSCGGCGEKFEEGEKLFFSRENVLMLDHECTGGLDEGYEYSEAEQRKARRNMCSKCFLDTPHGPNGECP